MEPKKVLVVLPAYNEAEAIHKAVTTVRTTCPLYDVLVVNDGSSDNTAEEARKAGALVISLIHNIGIGGAVQTGFLYAYRNGYDTMVQFDGDNQHPVDRIEKIQAEYLFSG